MEWLTTKKYSDKYGIHRQSVIRLCEQGKLNCKKVGNVWRIADEVEPLAKEIEDYTQAVEVFREMCVEVSKCLASLNEKLERLEVGSVA